MAVMVPKIVGLLKLLHQAKKKGLLEEFGINVTEIARRGDIDPVIGRDDEIIPCHRNSQSPEPRIILFLSVNQVSETLPLSKV